MLRVDAQVHVWKADSPDRPWPPYGAEGAARHRPVPITGEQLLKEMDEAGVDAAVLVPPYFEGYHNEYAEEVAQAHPDRFRRMLRLNLRADDAEAQVRAVPDEPFTPGVRLLFIPPDSGPIASGVADWFWPVVQELDLPVMMIAPNQTADVGEVAKKYPNLRIAIDHLGLSGAQKDDAIGPEIDAVLALASLPNVSVKVMSAPSYSTEPYPHPAIQPHLERLLDAYGAQRLFWGSDLSRLNGTYSQLVSFWEQELSFLKGDDLEQVMGKALCSWLKWTPGS